MLVERCPARRWAALPLPLWSPGGSAHLLPQWARLKPKEGMRSKPFVSSLNSRVATFWGAGVGLGKGRPRGGRGRPWHV